MKSLLKFITCGSVDDGKSTLIGHMLYDAKLLFADQRRALELDSKVNSKDGTIDYALLLDGLIAEREQRITIDVAYRYFTTQKRSFIVADTPGHEEYTRNMAVGASFADLAVILVDARRGILIQTRRHTRICSLMGIKHFVFAVNKMDLISYDQHRFEQIKKEIETMTSEYDYKTLQIIPVSAKEGDNVTQCSSNMTWYIDAPLLPYLEKVDIHKQPFETGFSMPVQRICRPDHTFRGFQGQIETGIISVGEEVTILPSGEKASVKSILESGKEVFSSDAGHAVTISLNREVDVSRGCVFIRGAAPALANLFTAQILWMDDAYLAAGKSYILKLGTKMIPAVLTKIKYKIDVNTGQKIPTDSVYKNEIVVCDISVSDKIVLDAFSKNQSLGSLILINRITNMTSACGIVLHALNRFDNLFWHEMDITRDFRARQKNQTPKTIWLTGLSGSGKSTLANELEKRLAAQGKHTMLLDGDNVRMGLNGNLGFKEEDRIENIRRIAEVAKLMNDAGLIVITSLISPFSRDRRNAQEIIGMDSFIEVYVSTPLKVCEKRDTKGLYKKARDGHLPNFTGISSPYEVPEHPHIIVDTSFLTPEACVDFILEEIKDKIEETSI